MEKINQWLWEDKETTESTNDDAMELSDHLTGDSFIISAKEQTKGRGRRGRNWVSLSGNLFFSQALNWELKDLGQLICLSSLSLWETVDDLIEPPHQVQIKWPNDILLNGCKLTGTLLEKGAKSYMIVGTGVNISAAPQSAEMIYPVISLAEIGINIDRLTFLKSYIDKFDKNYAQWRKSGFTQIKQRWLSAVKGLGNPIGVKTLQDELTGVFDGIGEQGELLLKQDGKINKIYAGDIFYIKKDE